MSEPDLDDNDETGSVPEVTGDYKRCRCCAKKASPPPPTPKPICTREFWNDRTSVLEFVSAILGILGAALLLLQFSRAPPNFSDPDAKFVLCSTTNLPTVSVCATMNATMQPAAVLCKKRFEAVSREELSEYPQKPLLYTLAIVDIVAIVILVAGYALLALPYLCCCCWCPCCCECCARCGRGYLRCCHHRISSVTKCWDVITWPLILSLDIATLVISWTLSSNVFFVVRRIFYRLPGMFGATVRLDDCFVNATTTMSSSSCEATIQRVLTVIGENVIPTTVNATTCARDQRYYSDVRSMLKSELVWSVVLIVISTGGIAVDIARNCHIKRQRKKQLFDTGAEFSVLPDDESDKP